MFKQIDKFIFIFTFLYFHNFHWNGFPWLNFTELICVNSIVLIAIVIVLAIPIFGLTGFHMVLVSRGRTTNEQVTGKFKGGYNPFSRGCWHNCCYTQFGPQYPRSVSNQSHANPIYGLVFYLLMFLLFIFYLYLQFDETTEICGVSFNEGKPND